MRLLGSGDTTVTLDGVDCPIITSTLTKESATCITGAQPSPSAASGQYVGSSGLRRNKYTSTGSITVGDIVGTADPVVDATTGLQTQELLTSFEITSSGEYSANIISGYFVPPTTGDYKFYATCDDRCLVKLSTSDMNPSPDNFDDGILQLNSAVGVGRFWENADSASSWITLTEGLHYYIEMHHVNDRGSGHASLHVEIKGSPSTTHPNNKREV